MLVAPRHFGKALSRLRSLADACCACMQIERAAVHLAGQLLEQQSQADERADAQPTLSSC